jgi:hypothetical protein
VPTRTDLVEAEADGGAAGTRGSTRSPKRAEGAFHIYLARSSVSVQANGCALQVAAQRDPTRVFQPTMNSLLRIEVNGASPQAIFISDDTEFLPVSLGVEDGGGEAGPAEIKGSRKTSLGSARHTKRCACTVVAAPY